MSTEEERLFWNSLFEKKGGEARYKVFTDPDSPENDLMVQWLRKWCDELTYFYNSGCGCCINIYEFDAPPEAVSELPEDLVEDYVSPNTPSRTGTPSTFSQFEKLARERFGLK